MNSHTSLNISLAVILAFSFVIIFFLLGLLRPLGAFSLAVLVIFIAAGAIYTITRLAKV